MFRKINNANLINNQGGAIIVEFTLVIFITVLFIKLLITIAEYQSISGKLDRYSYSIAGIIRERGRLYQHAPDLNQQQVDQLREFVHQALLNSGVPADSLTMKIETLHFRSVEPPGSRQQEIDEQKSLSLSHGNCFPVQPLHESAALSPLSQSERWIPLYQVTLCLDAPLGFLGLINTASLPPLKSSAITIGRELPLLTDKESITKKHISTSLELPL